MQLLTIIIPVYKVEKTLRRCVESITNQRDCDFEIVLVDDGSPDFSPAICDELALEDGRINVIHKENGGLSDARNKGIEIAKGDYITFVDSDDFIGEDSLCELMSIMERHPEYDILEYPIYRFYGSRHAEKLTFEEKTYSDMEEYWLSCHAYEHAYACNKIYKRHLFDEVRFPKGCVFEDIHTLPKILDKTKIVATTGKGLYYYCENENGITAKAKGKEKQMLLDAHIPMIRKYSSSKLKEQFGRYYLKVLNIQLDAYMNTETEPKLPYFNPSISKDTNFSSAIKAVALKILGVKRLCQLNKQISRIYRSRW